MTPGGLEPGYLAGRLLLIEHRVRRAVAATRATDPDPDDPLRGLRLSVDGAERLLAGDRSTDAGQGGTTGPERGDAPGSASDPDPGSDPGSDPDPDPGSDPDLGPDPELDPDSERAAALAAETWADRAEAAGADVRLRRLARDFGLSPLDVDVLLAALLPDLDPRYERLYGYLNDDLTRRRATIGLAMRLAGASMAYGPARARFSATAPLVTGGLLIVQEPDRPFLTRSLRVPDRIAGHLLGDDTPDGRLTGVLHPALVQLAGASAASLGAALRTATRLVYLRQKPGGAAEALAAGGLAAAGYVALRLDLGALAAEPDPVTAVAVAGVEARLRGGGLIAGPVEALVEARGEGEPSGSAGTDTTAIPAAGGRLLRRLAALDVPVLLTGATRWDPEWSERAPLLVTVEPMDTAGRVELWNAVAELPAEVDLGEGLAPYVLGPQQIRRAAAVAARQAALDGVDRIGTGHVRAGVRSQNSAGLDRLARRVEPAVGWSDLVLPEPTRQMLEDLALRVRHRDQVLGGWRLRPGGGRGRGVTALFAGDSGTGKTMSAEVVAADLGLDLYVVDLSTVVDKYVGQTEKNLERIFTEAVSVNAVLLFDEADAIFGKRSEVSDAHDRYANIESAYLLQRMESFDGVAVLTTNLRANLDEAFTRRLDVIVDFPMPDAAHRRALWDHCLGSHLPRAGDLDLAFCAEAFELSGGGIRACAVTAGYLAAADGGTVTMAHLLTAAQREYRKLGRLIVDGAPARRRSADAGWPPGAPLGYRLGRG